MKKPRITIRRLRPDDKEAWLTLWRGYLKFYRAKISDEVTEQRFNDLCDGKQLVGFVATNTDDLPIGLLHLIFHPSTWSLEDSCYINDLFIHPEYRGEAIAEMLFEKAYALADERNAGKTYWLTQEYNGAGRSLYDTFAKRTSFVVYNRIS